MEKGEEICWTVPCFPVLDIEFTKVKIVLDEKQCWGLMRTADIAEIEQFPTENILSWRNCKINIDEFNFVVIWKWEMQKQLPEDWEEISESESNCSSISETDLSSEADTDREDTVPFITHTLPFKVLGVAHTKEHQDHLMKAKLKMGESKESVSAHIVPEPDNEKDSHAISVMLDYGQGQCRVGYIARELTKFIHPLLANKKIINVRIQKITFRTTWQRMGLYVTLHITRNGEWEPFVVSAARHVK